MELAQGGSAINVATLTKFMMILRERQVILRSVGNSEVWITQDLNSKLPYY